MENNFNFINFSFFEIDSLTAMKEAVREVFIQDFQKGKANFIKTPFIISEFIDPSYGGKHDDVFCCWQVSHYPNKIFFISNSGDGRITLCNVLRLKLHCSFYQFALSNDNASPFFLFHHSSKQGITRDVLNYKEDRWQFYAKGPINSIEEIEFYKNRKIRERLNKEILLHFLKKMGISFWDIDKSVTDYFIVKRSV